MNTHLTRLVCLAAVSILTSPLTAQADLVYGDTGFSTFSSFYSDVDRNLTEQADDFTLPGGSNLLTGIHWWGHLADGFPDSSYSFTFTVYAAAPDLSGPDTGAVVWQVQQDVPWNYSGEVMDPETYSYWDEDTQQYLELRYIAALEYILPEPLALDGGETYYLSIVADTSAQMPDDWRWCAGGPGTHASRNRLGDSWNDYAMSDWSLIGDDLAFYLTYNPVSSPNDPDPVVPEPATLFLLGTGLSVLSLRQRFRRN